MERINPEGVPRADLKYHLSRPDHVKTAVETDTCLACRGPRVNEAGLCDLCTTRLTDEELNLVEQWMSGLIRYE